MLFVLVAEGDRFTRFAARLRAAPLAVETKDRALLVERMRHDDERDTTVVLKFGCEDVPHVAELVAWMMVNGVSYRLESREAYDLVAFGCKLNGVLRSFGVEAPPVLSPQ